MATSSTRIQSLWDRFVELIAPASTGDGGPDLCWRRVMTVFASGGAFLFLLITLALIIYRLYFHPIRHYPGPRWWAASRLPWIRSTIKGTIVHDLLALHKQYGPVVRVAPNELSYITPDATKTIYQSNPEFPKDPMHLPAFHNGTPGILAADKRNHSRYRRLLASGFSDKGMRAQQPMIQYYIKLLLQRLRERSGSGSQDISEGYNWITFDIIGDLAFGESFDCLQNGKTHDWIASIQGNVKAIPIINAIRRFKLDWVIPLIAPKKLLEMRRKNAKFTEDKVDRRLRFGASRGDLWDDVIERSDKEGDSGMSRQEMISNASAIVLAGSETSATLLSGCTWFLLKNPHQLRQLESHVRSSFASETEIDLISVGKLDYMLAVLDEVLRLYPPVPVQSNRIVTKGGAMIAGQWVPEGVSPMALFRVGGVQEYVTDRAETSVAVQHYAACRSSANFHRPDEFLPQRWLGDREFAHDRREASQPFSVGPRNCIGRQLAYTEMRLILAKILWHFDLRLDESKMGERDWLAEQGVWILWNRRPLWVHFRPRTEDERA